MRGTSARSRSSCPTASPARRAAAASSSARATSSTCGSTRGRVTRRCCRSRQDLRWPADIYLEGSDQHRGWFHSSLLVGIGTRGRAPFDQVLTHGFVVDEQGGRCRSRVGNTIAPQDVMKQSGADVLRLWVSMVDYREDIRLGKEILARVVEAYRKFRNVLRVLVANLYDFDPATDVVRGRGCSRSIAGRMARYAGVAARMIVSATTTTTIPASTRRRTRSSPSTSARSTSTSRRTGCTRSARSRRRAAPDRPRCSRSSMGWRGCWRRSSPFTMDEVWRSLPGDARGLGAPGAVPDGDAGGLAQTMRCSTGGTQLSAVRNLVNAGARREAPGTRSSSRTSRRGSASRRRAPLASCSADYRDELPTLFGVSQVDVAAGCHRARRPTGRASVRVERADGVKCERCWRFVPAVSDDAGGQGAVRPLRRRAGARRCSTDE